MSFKRWQTFDWSLYLLPIIILALGIATIYTVTFINRGNALALDQAIFAGCGLVLMFVLTFVDYRIFKGLVIPLYFIGLIFLALLVIKPFSGSGLVITTYGATRWIDLKFFQLQPSEFFKAVLIITLAAYLSNKRDNIKWWNVLWVMIMTAAPVWMILRQPDLGTATVLVMIMLAMLIVAALPRIYYFIFGAGTLVLAPIIWYFLAEYQKQRFITFFNPAGDPLGRGYNVLQSLIAVGSGGLSGRGFGQGSQSQLNFLPVAHTDFIFAGFAEATGFIGAFFLVSVFLLLFVRLLNVARVAKDDFGMLLAVGVGTMLMMQAFVNIGMNIAIMPVTGIPLPFMSYGGTALIIYFILIGIMQSIYMRHKKITF